MSIKNLTTNNQSLKQSVSSSSQINAVVEFIKKHNTIIAALSVGTLSAAAFLYLYKNNNFISKQPQKPHTTKNKHKPLTTRKHNNQQDQNSQHLLQQQQQSQQQKQIKQQLQRLKSRREKLQTHTRQFKIQYVDEQILTLILSQDCVLNIFDLCVELVDEEELNELYNKNRKARRTVYQHILTNAQIKHSNRRESIESSKSLMEDHHSPRDSLPLNITSPKNILSIKNKLKHISTIQYPEALFFSEVYYRFVCTFEEDFKYLIEKTQKDFAAFLSTTFYNHQDIDFNLITQSIDFHISKENNEYFKQKIQEWTSQIKQSLKYFLQKYRNKLERYSFPIQPSLVCTILRSQIEYLQQKRQKLLETINKLGISNEDELNALPTFLQSLLEDEVYSRFGIEQEQMTVDMGQLDKNKELQILVGEFQQLTERIVQDMYEEVNQQGLYNDQKVDESMEIL